MQVSLSVDALSPNLSGIGRYCWELVRGLDADARVDCVRYFIRGNWVSDPSKLVEPEYEIQRKGRWRDAVDLWLNHRRFCDSVVHSPNYFLPDWAERGIATVHDLSVFKFPETHPAERIKAFELGFADTIARAGMILTDCEWVRREVIEYTGIAAHRVAAVPLGVGPEFRPHRADELNAFASQHGLSAGAYGLCVSTLEPRKRIGRLIAAWRSLSPRLRCRHPLVIAGGSGWCNEDLMAEIERAQAEGWLHYLGYVGEAELPLLFAGARVFAYPSQYEGFGFPPLEAMASGVPTIVAAGTCLEETAGPAAVMTDPDDVVRFSQVIEQLLTDDQAHARLSSAGIQHTSQYGWQRCIAGTVDAYQNLLEG